MTTGEVCNRETVIADSEAPIVEIAKLMRRHHVGDIVIIEQRDGENIPIGISSSRSSRRISISTRCPQVI